MLLTRLRADRLRNLSGLDLSLPAGLTVLHGNNGEGKSSVLEGIYLLGTGRSFRTRRLEDAMAWSGGPLRVDGDVTTRTGENHLAVVVETGQRQLLVGGSERDLESYLGRLDVVDLTAARMQVLRGPPHERRRFLDRGVVSLEPVFLSVLGEYRRTLQQRNALLRRGNAHTTLAAWEQPLAASARRVHERRRRLVARLGALAAELAPALLGSAVDLRLEYLPSPAASAEKDVGVFEGVFLEALEKGREKDLSLGYTTVGPHRDDVLIRLDGVDLRKFGSAGQQRAAMIIFKLARLALTNEERGEPPLFLMDDFDSDLDETRAAVLASFLDAGGFQAVVATSKTELADRLPGPVHRVLVKGGAAHAA